MDLSEQIADYERKYPSVPPDSPPGTIVVFHGHGGYPNEQEAAKNVLLIGEAYVLEGASIGGWSSTFFLEGVAGAFNSSMFSPEGWIDQISDAAEK